MFQRKPAWIHWCILALAFTCNDITGLQFSPVPLTGAGDGECALLLNGPGRSSSFDYSLNLLRGGNGFGYNGPHTCITYDAVNQAYLEARKRVQVAQPHGDYKAEDVATVGELLLDISVNLARTYGLSYEDIEKGLPLIDTSKTLIREVCPPFLSNVECRPGKYRRFDGLCTNLENPTWGSTMQPFTRLIGPLYADGMTAPRISVTGNQLPLSRIVSRTMHPDEGYHDHAGTVMVIAWGQFIDHDYTLTGTPLDPLNRNDPEECCKRPPHLKNPYCNEIIIPADDYFYRLFSVRCIDFVRGFPAARPGCRLGSRSQFNTLTGVLDANTVYGVTEKFSRKLRSGHGGQMRMNPVFREYGLKDMLPLKLDIPDEGCTRPNRSMYCFEAGEIRVNEQLVLTCMHTLMAREHNRIAESLQQVNPHWDDETLFQESRRINIAVIQHITYNEFLPILLGKEVMEKFGLLLQKDGYWNGYDSSVNPNVIDAFAAAAYRFGHSLLPTAVERWSKAHKFIASKRLSDLIRRPYDLYRAGVFDEYFMGLMNQVAQAMDDSITQEVTNHLFKKIGARFGMDLVSFNMQRGREFGLPGYMEFRKFCGLPGADSFEELFGSMPNETIKKYSTIFEHPHDVDLWSGGVSERPLPGSMLGPTFACIIATQFSYSRRGDRFWYELPNQPSSFTPEQLKEIRKARMARVICDNTDLIDTIQLYPMVLPDHEINPRVPCRSGVLPRMDFTKWADHGSPHFQQHQPFANKQLLNVDQTKPNLINFDKSQIKSIPLQPINLSPLFDKNVYNNIIANQINYGKTVKNIKILPPLVLKPAIESRKIYRHKRSTENITLELQNKTISENETLLKNNTKSVDNENITASPLNDQVTQAIIVTEISGSPQPAEENDDKPLNFNPFAITSSDFQNNTSDSYSDIGKLFEEKLKEIQSPALRRYDFSYNERPKNTYVPEDKNNEKETITNDNENEEVLDMNRTEDQQENIESVPHSNKLIINVPESSSENDQDENNRKNKELNDNEENDKKDRNIQPEIDEEISRHFIDYPQEKSLKISDANEDYTESDRNENNPSNLEENKDEEDLERKEYFDDLIQKQFEINEQLKRDLEYPELDNDYEKYRKTAFEEYMEKKQDDFTNAGRPYEIKLEGYYPYDKESFVESDYVDEGTDKMRIEENEENQENEEPESENIEENNDEENTENNEEIASVKEYEVTIPNQNKNLHTNNLSLKINDNNYNEQITKENSTK